MSQIKILDALTANQIAAGEVVERPASVVKELCENSIDAHAKRIVVEIRQGGVEYISVTDDGKGMDKEDLILAFEPHATSKISEIQDLLHLKTKGFRGEALASIASVSKIFAKSKAYDASEAYALQLEAGTLLHFEETLPIQGTQIEVKDLFFNTPARYKFLKKDSTEAEKVREVVLRLALAHPHIAFVFISNHKTLFSTPGNGVLEDAVYALLGAKFLQDLILISPLEEEGIKIFGFIGQPEAAKRSRTSQYFYVNQRFVKSQTLSAAVDQVYQHRLMKGLYPSCILFLEVDGHLVDVNVHPQKLEVKFSDSGSIFKRLIHVIEAALEVHIRPPHQSTQKAYQVYQDLYQEFFNESSPPQKLISGSSPIAVLQEKEEQPSHSIPLTLSSSPKKEDTSLVSEAVSEVFLWPDEEKEEPKVLSKAAHERAFQAKQSSYLDIPSTPLKTEGGLKLSHLKYIGSAFNTFLIFEDKQTLWWIDQHAAHEKIIFEQLYGTYQKEKRVPVQHLLIPLEIYFSKQEMSKLEQERAQFLEMGLNFDVFSEESILLRTIPYLPEAYLPKEIFLDAVQFLSIQDKSIQKKSTDVFFYDYLAEVSCKAAIKANHSLSSLEIETLVKDLETLEQAHHCPHGRPLIIQISKQELERRFKRIL